MSLTIDAPEKWADNVLSQFDLLDNPDRRRGLARGISWPMLVKLGLVRALHQRLGCGVREAVALATEMLDAAQATVQLGGTLTVAINRQEFEQALEQRLSNALETAPRPRRGRPPMRGLQNA